LSPAELARFNIPSGDRIWTCRPTHALQEASLPGTAPWLTRRIDELSSELEAAYEANRRLRSRKVVRAGLGLAALAKPLVRASRRWGRPTQRSDDQGERVQTPQMHG
jgi:hypothetical protein